MINVREAILENEDILVSYARKLTQDRETAKDLYQDTMFKALTHHTSFNRGADVRFDGSSGASRVGTAS